MIPDDLLYSRDDEWVRVEGGNAVIGITHHAQKKLGDVVFVDLPRPGATATAGSAFGALESVKAASDCHAPVSGEIVAVNVALAESPEWINNDPYGKGWMLRVKLGNRAELGALLTPAAYAAFLAESEK
jgi:glycine cleavage system H protein